MHRLCHRNADGSGDDGGEEKKSSSIIITSCPLPGAVVVVHCPRLLPQPPHAHTHTHTQASYVISNFHLIRFDHFLATHKTIVSVSQWLRPLTLLLMLQQVGYTTITQVDLRFCSVVLLRAVHVEH